MSLRLGDETEYGGEGPGCNPGLLAWQAIGCSAPMLKASFYRVEMNKGPRRRVFAPAPVLTASRNAIFSKGRDGYARIRSLPPPVRSPGTILNAAVYGTDRIRA